MSSNTLRHPRVAVMRCVDATTIGDAAADIVIDTIQATPSPVVGVATGSSPSPLYAALSAMTSDFSAVTWFALDEYIGLPRHHPQSYAEVLRREIIEPLSLDPTTVHLPNPHVDDLDQSAVDYEERIASAGGIDVQILGIGRNGHLAFNEPGAPLDSRTRVEQLTDDTRRANQRFFDSLADVPTHCLTQGLGTILEARHLLLIAQGGEKAEALYNALTGPVTASCPASVLQLHGRVTVLVDGEAGALLV